MKRFLKTALASAVMCAALGATSANAAIAIQKDSSVVVNIPGLTGFSTTGAMMDGLDVTAVFANGYSTTLNWADTNASSGGVVDGNLWSLTQSGDTFNNVWRFNFFGTAFSNLVKLVLDGQDNFTVFDTSTPNPGTGGSASGANFDVITPNSSNSWSGTAIYDLAVSIGGAPVVGDLFQRLTINFTDPSINRDFTFIQDTDNDSRAEVPEPSSVALLGLALAALGAASARRRNRRV